jgi:hypothetical protein
MNIKEQENQIRLFAAIVIIIALLIIMLIPHSGFSQSDVKHHAKLQREYNYESRIKANKAFTLASAKDNLKISKANNRKNARHKKHLARIIEIQNRIKK